MKPAFNDPKIASLQRYIYICTGFYAFLPRDSSNEWLWIAKRKQADKTMTNVVDQSVRQRKQNCRLCRLWIYIYIYIVDLSLGRGRTICKECKYNIGR